MRTFFFARESPRLTALVRIALGLVLLGDALGHWRYAIELYSKYGPPMPTFIRQVDEPAEGPIDADSLRVPQPIRVAPLLPTPVPAPHAAVVAHTLLVFALASVVLGWHARMSLAAAFVLALWLAPLDVATTFGKHFVVALHLLLLLAFSHCGAALSLDALADRDRAIRCLLSSACPRRLMQILICSVYVGAVITKLKSPTFTNGDLITFSLLDDRWGGGRFGMWLTTVRHVPLLLSHATLMFEILFPVLVWLPRWRLAMVAAAYVVHASMAWLLSLGIFSPVMFAALLAFLEEKDLARFGRLLSSLSQRKREMRAIYGAGWHLLAAGVFVAAGFCVQYACDWYGVFGRRALAPLNELPADDVAEMLAERPLAWEDYFHRVELGSRFGGNQVFGSPDRFRVGQRAYVLTQMPMPHPAVELEGLLITPDGRKCARFTHRFDAGFSYAINGFELTPELPAGSYRVILRVEDFVVAERRFELER